jgi:hypothetical protein
MIQWRRLPHAWSLGFVVATLLSAEAGALEKHAKQVLDSPIENWNAGATCRISYYNICTGWIWCWGGYGGSFRLGMVVDSCCGPGATASLLQSTFFICESSAPCYYGFWGTVGIHSVDGNDCPVGPPVAIQPYCPNYAEVPFSVLSWGGIAVPSRFAIIVTFEGNFWNPLEFATDHPAAGATGPQACGVCYPENRMVHSYLYGTPASPICPGSTFNDGVCDAELFWDVDLACAVSVEETSWGKIKGLYR